MLSIFMIFSTSFPFNLAYLDIYNVWASDIKAIVVYFYNILLVFSMQANWNIQCARLPSGSILMNVGSLNGSQYAHA